MTTRREMLRTTALLGGAAMIGSSFSSQSAFAQETGYEANTIYSTMLGWRIGPQIYSFNRFPFEEAIKKVKQTGAMSFELFSGHRLSAKDETRIGPGMNKDSFKRFRELVAESGCVPHGMGVCGADRAHFEFALSIGISNINVEPGFDKLPEVTKLSEEYGVNVGLHNHPKPSIYWDPKLVLEKLADCGPRVGVCCDTGHWYRSGLDPLEAVKLLKGRIFSFHIKDLNEAKRDVPLGKGVCKIEEILKEIAAQGVRGTFSIEYESDWENNVGQVTEGISFFNSTAKAIVTG